MFENIPNITNDIAFKMLFGSKERKHLLISFLSSLLNIPKDELQDITVIGSEIFPSTANSKLFITDLLVESPKYLIDIEMQNKKMKCYENRAEYYSSRLFESSIPKGSDYSDGPTVIVVNLLNFDLFNCDTYKSIFITSEINRNEKLTLKKRNYFFELKKLPKEIHTDNMAELWLKFISAKSKEDFDMLIKIDNPDICEAFKVATNFSAIPEAKYLEYFKDKDEVNRKLDMAIERAEGKIEGKEEGTQIAVEQSKTVMREYLTKQGKTENEIQEALKLFDNIK